MSIGFRTPLPVLISHGVPQVVTPPAVACRSMVAFWMGGACLSTDTPAPTRRGGGGHVDYRVPNTLDEWDFGGVIASVIECEGVIH